MMAASISMGENQAVPPMGTRHHLMDMTHINDIVRVSWVIDVLLTVQDTELSVRQHLQ